MSRLRVEPLDLVTPAAARVLQVAALRTVAEATGVGCAYGMTALPGSWWDTWVRGPLTDASRQGALGASLPLADAA